MRVLTHSTVHPGLVDFLVLLEAPNSKGYSTVERTASVRRSDLRPAARGLADTAIGYMVNELKHVSAKGGVSCTSSFSLFKSVSSRTIYQRTDSAEQWRQMFKQHLVQEMTPSDSLKIKFRNGARDAGIDTSEYDKLARDVRAMSPCLRSAMHICFYGHDESKKFEHEILRDNGLPCHMFDPVLDSDATKPVDAVRLALKDDRHAPNESRGSDTGQCLQRVERHQDTAQDPGTTRSCNAPEHFDNGTVLGHDTTVNSLGSSARKSSYCGETRSAHQ